MIKSFRGLLADGEQARITLHTNDGKTGYRIVKFQLIQEEPGTASVEHTVKIYKTEQTTIDNNINFTDHDLLGAATYHARADAQRGFIAIIFDSEIFNQDVYVTHEDTDGTSPCNYYIELEQISLDLNGSTVATLQSLRSA